MVPIQGHLLSLKTNLKKIFELPCVLEMDLKHTNESLSNTNIFTSFLNGSTRKK